MGGNCHGGNYPGGILLGVIVLEPLKLKHVRLMVKPLKYQTRGNYYNKAHNNNRTFLFPIFDLDHHLYHFHHFRELIFFYE